MAQPTPDRLSIFHWPSPPLLNVPWSTIPVPSESTALLSEFSSENSLLTTNPRSTEHPTLLAEPTKLILVQTTYAPIQTSPTTLYAALQTHQPHAEPTFPTLLRRGYIALPNQPPPSSSVNIVLIAGGIIGGIFAFAGLIFIIQCCACRCRRRYHLRGCKTTDIEMNKPVHRKTEDVLDEVQTRAKRRREQVRERARQEQQQQQQQQQQQKKKEHQTSTAAAAAAVAPSSNHTRPTHVPNSPPWKNRFYPQNTTLTHPPRPMSTSTLGMPAEDLAQAHAWNTPFGIETFQHGGQTANNHRNGHVLGSNTSASGEKSRASKEGRATDQSRSVSADWASSDQRCRGPVVGCERASQAPLVRHMVSG